MSGGNPYLQDVTPDGAPGPVTPQASPGDEAGWAKVTPTEDGEPAPYSISAPQNIDGITAAFNAANALAGAGVLYPMGPRQAEAKAILESPAGAASSNVFAGFPDYENNNISPAADLQTPIQGEMGAYPVSNTYQPGLTQFTAGLGAGVAGVPPENSSMGGSAMDDYPGTTQDGVPTYGT